MAVRAIQWTGTNKAAVAAFIGDDDLFERDEQGREVVAIPTLEGVMVAERGSWLIEGVVGEFYPCRNDVFTQLYEPV